jgi:hypothetical protein
MVEDTKAGMVEDSVELYEPPMMVEVGRFTEDTLGAGDSFDDVLQYWGR